jgi:hypothetical protein
MLVKTDNALVLWARFLSLVLGYVGDTGEPYAAASRLRD